MRSASGWFHSLLAVSRLNVQFPVSPNLEGFHKAGGRLMPLLRIIRFLLADGRRTAKFHAVASLVVSCHLLWG